MFIEDLTNSLCIDFSNTDVYDLSLNNLNDCFENSVTNCLNTHAPLIESRPRSVTIPKWMDNEFISERAKRRRLHKILCRHPLSHNNRMNYITQRNLVAKLADVKRTNYYNNMINSLSGDQKALYNFLQSTAG